MKFLKKFLILFFIVLFSTYSFADDNLLVDDLDTFQISETANLLTEEPKTNSKNIIVLDRKTLSILYEKSPYQKVPMASTTKIMTCIIALENANLNDIVTVSKNAASIQGSTLGLSTNMKISMQDLLYGLMLRSGNDCAIAIAEYISGSLENFATLMNQKAQDLKLLNTNFVTPHGLDDSNHFTTAYDLAMLTDYALKNSKFREIVSTKICTISLNNSPRTISNTNELLGNLEGVYGVKTGFTFGAGRCLVSSCKRGNLDIIVVVLGADTKKIRTQDSSNLIKYVFGTYKYVNVQNTIESAFNDYIHYFNKHVILEKTTIIPKLKLQKLDNYDFPLKTNGDVKLHTKIYMINKFSPNILTNSKVGTLQLYNNNELLCKTDIILENTLNKNSWSYYFHNILKSLSNF